MLAFLRKVKQHTVSNFKYIKYRQDKKRLDATRLFDTFQFPPEFDEIIYKKCYKDLSQYDNDQLYDH